MKIIKKERDNSDNYSNNSAATYCTPMAKKEDEALDRGMSARAMEPKIKHSTMGYFVFLGHRTSC